MNQVTRIPEKIVDENDAEMREFLLRKLGLSQMPAGGRILGFKTDTGPVVGWLFERYTGPGGAVHTHWAGRKHFFLKRYMLTLVAMYVFDQMKCEVVVGEVPASDLYVRSADEKLGFKEVATIKGYFPGDDLVIYTMTRDACRFLPDEFKTQEAEKHG